MRDRFANRHPDIVSSLTNMVSWGWKSVYCLWANEI